MTKSLTRRALFGIFLPFALLATFNLCAAEAERMAFSYRFVGNSLPQGIPDDENWGPGAQLTGQIYGSIDPANSDTVIINAFEKVVLSRPTLEIFEFDAIDASEFSAASSPAAAPVVSFSGGQIDFKSCPGGFTDDTDGDGVLDDCAFGVALGGGFLLSDGTIGSDFATAADGTGADVCRTEEPDPREQPRIDGCRVADSPILQENWGLVRLPDGVDVDASAFIGSGTTIKKDIVIKRGVVLGKNVTLNQFAVIGANSMIGNDTILKKGVYVCPNITIGSVVTIGKNRLVDRNVPDGIVWIGTKNLPDPRECP